MLVLKCVQLKNFYLVLHVWLMTCWKCWIPLFQRDIEIPLWVIVATNFFFDPITFSGCQGHQSITNRQKTKQKNHQFVFTADEKNVRNCAHWEHQWQKPSYFFIYSIWTRARSRTWIRARTRTQAWSWELAWPPARRGVIWGGRGPSPPPPKE